MSQEINIDELIKLISCPLSGQIFNIPVVDENGDVREKNEIIKKMNCKVRIVKSLQNFIKLFLDQYPQYKKLQYVCENKNSMNHEDNLDDIASIIKLGKYNELLKYKRFDVSLISIFAVGNFPENVLMYFVDNCVSLNVEIGNGFSFFNHICRHYCETCPNVVKLALKKDTDMKHACKTDGWLPLHQIINFSKDDELIKQAILKHLACGLDLYLRNNDGLSIIDIICVEKSQEIIFFALTHIDKNCEQFVDLKMACVNKIQSNKYLDDDARELLLNMVL